MSPPNMANPLNMKNMRKLFRSAIRAVLLPVLILTATLAIADTVQYNYDANGRLVTVSALTWSIQYSYDAAGNVSQIVRTTTNGLLISTFSPTSGHEGDTVTIQGGGFSTTPANNLVKFNGAVATVTSATATSLVTQVPQGATTGPISVAVSANTVSSQTSFTVVPFPPDLTIMSFSAGTVAGNADGSYSIPVTFTVKNNGQGNAKASWGDYCYISADATLDSSDPAVGSAGRSADLAPMASYTVNTTCTTTTSISSGNYTLFVKTDGAASMGNYAATGAIAESDETNNVASASVVLPARDLPDLSAGAVSIGAVSVNQDGSYAIPASFAVTNIGQGVASASWTDYCYLSTNGALDSASAVIGSTVRSVNLSAGAQYTATLSCLVPATVNAGTYTLFVKADGGAASGQYSAAGVVNEFNEANNTSSGSLVLPQRPDLVISALSLGSPTTLQSGAYSFTASFTIANNGGSAAKASWSDYCYLSNDATLDASDLALGSAVRSTNLAAGASYMATLTCTTPTTTAAGSYTVIVKADATASSGSYSAVEALVETDKSNNVASASVVLPQRPDLVLSNLSVGLATRNANGSYSLSASFQVANVGGSAAKATWTDYCYVSADGTLDTSDAVAGTSVRAIDLAAGANYTVNLSCTSPASTSAGTYTVFVKVDGGAIGSQYAATNAIAETDETNNVGSAAILFADKPDLVVSGLALGTASRNSSGVYTFTASFTVTNLGGVSASPTWPDSCYLSADATLDTSDIALGFGTHSTSLAPGASYVANLTCSTPANYTPGTYTVIVKTDGASAGGLYTTTSSVTEWNETNNTASASVYLPQLPDLTVSNLVLGTASRNSSGAYTFTANFTVTNSGESTAFPNWVDYCYVSSDATLNTSDWAVASATRTTQLNAGASYNVALTCTTPASFTPGTYTAFVKADGFSSGGFYSSSSTLTEGNETNNTASASIYLPQLPDLTVSNLVLGTVSRNASNQYTYTASFTVNNIGESTAFPNWTDYCYLSSNGVLDTASATLGSATRTTLVNAGGTYNVVLTCTTAANVTPGNYTAFVKADGFTSGGFFNNTSTLTESNETNNTASASVYLPQLPDLTVSNLVLGTASRNSSGAYTFTANFTVTNSGESTAFPNWVDYCYVSSDATLNTSDWAVASATRTTQLNAGASYNVALTCTTPASFTPGTYTAFVKADGFSSGGFYSSSSTLTEGNETNNTASASIYLPQLPDLTVSGLALGTPTKNGSNAYTFTASFTVTNSGESTAFPTWTDNCYVSADASLSTADWAVGSATHTISLASGASYMVTLTCTTPTSFTAGTYTVFVKADGSSSGGFYAATSTVPETDETNNVASLTIVLP